MSESSILKISRIISTNGDSQRVNLNDINDALKNIYLILEKEEIRKSQIKDELKIQQSNVALIEKLSIISFLEENLEKIEENIYNLKNYVEILNAKKVLAQFQSNSYVKEIKNSIDLNDSFLYN